MAALRKVLALDPNHAAAYLQIGVLQLKTDAGEAERSFNQALTTIQIMLPPIFAWAKFTTTAATMGRR